MGLEEDLFNAFKYAGFSQKTDPTKMIHTLITKLEISMLSQMQEKIRRRLTELSRQQGVYGASDDSMDPFVILGVDVNATREEVDKAYREKAKVAHPDKGGTNIEMARLNAAYEALRLFRGWVEK